MNRRQCRTLPMHEPHSPSTAKRPVRRGILAAALLALASAGGMSWPALAQSGSAYPNKPIKLIVPFTPGGVTDTSGRVIAEQLSKRLGQQVLVENKPGASGNIGTQQVAIADPDGYTLLYGTNSPFSVGPVVDAKAGYTAAAFVPIALVYQAPFVVSASRKSGVTSVAELVEAARRSPEAFSFASVGLATTT
ncbi:MAG: tripartite tricarboxylate transporter substrate binding protein, partial [Usitatibacteraceae bacterium]